jgi:ATPase subunit of ABC transporter with duplicated ATPase domains
VSASVVPFLAAPLRFYFEDGEWHRSLTYLSGARRNIAAKSAAKNRNLTKSFDGQHAVDDVSLTIYKGEIFALLGASGCFILRTGNGIVH